MRQIMWFVLVFSFITSVSLVLQPNPGQAEMGEGKMLFNRYCASCHGVSGMGDGPVANSLKSRPKDLTVLKAEAGGVFPEKAVRAAIDGRVMPRAHGSSQMPIWGEWFAAQAMAEGVLQEDRQGIEKSIQQRLSAILRYIKSLQK